jgi:hypothetical protein
MDASSDDAGGNAGTTPDGGNAGPVAPPTASGADGGDGAVGGEGGDAESAETGGPGASSPACTSLLCEDFERGQFDPTTWTIAAMAGTAVVEQTKAAHGKFAAQFHGMPASGYAFMIAKNAPPELRTHHFGRAYVSIGPTFPMGHTGLVYAGSAGTPGGDKYLEVAGVRGGWQLNFHSPAGEAPLRVGCTANVSGCPPTILRPAEPWICLQWEFNDQPDQIALSVDGKPITTYSPITFNNQTSNLVTGFVEFGFGFYNWHPEASTFDVYYDDIALDTKAVGCL